VHEEIAQTAQITYQRVKTTTTNWPSFKQTAVPADPNISKGLAGKAGKRGGEKGSVHCRFLGTVKCFGVVRILWQVEFKLREYLFSEVFPILKMRVTDGNERNMAANASLFISEKMNDYTDSNL
jgi:hypothetical protein